MIRKHLFITLIFACVLSLTGCSYIDMGAGDLLSPPQASEENAEIQAIITEEAGEGYTLIYPQSGDYRTAIVFADMNGDNEKEAICFFQKQSTKNSLTFILIMSEGKNGWERVGLFENKATAINHISFSDINGNGSPELLIAFGTFDEYINNISIYSFTDNGSSQIVVPEIDAFGGYVVSDFNGDGIDDIIALAFSNNKRPHAAILSWRNDIGTLDIFAETDLAGEITEFIQINKCLLSNQQPAIILDAKTASGDYLSQVLYYDTVKSIFKNKLFSATQSGNITFREIAVFSQDITNDGEIKIPVCEKFPYGTSEDTSRVATLTKFCKYDLKKDTLSTVISGVVNPAYGYFIKLPEKWADKKVTARQDSADLSLSFFRWNSDVPEAQATTQNTDSEQESEEETDEIPTAAGLGTFLLKIKTFTANEWSTLPEAKKYKQLAATNDYVFAYMIPENTDDLALTEAEVQALFMPIGS